MPNDSKPSFDINETREREASLSADAGDFDLQLGNNSIPDVVQKAVNVDLSLEAQLRSRVEMAMKLVDAKQESEALKEVKDLVEKTMYHICCEMIRMPSKKNPSVEVWDTQKMANVMGVAHAAVNRKINTMIENRELVPIDETGQEDLF